MSYESDLLRCMRTIVLTNTERLRFCKPLSPELEWFLTHIDELAPELHRRGWVERQDFHEEPGAVVATLGEGDVCQVIATPLGRAQLNAAVQ